MTLPKQPIENVLQRYREGKLTNDEHDSLLAELDARELEEAQSAHSPLRALERVSRIAVPDTLKLNVMASIAPKRPLLRTRVRTWLEQHALLGWQVGGTAVAAAILMLALTPQIAPEVQVMPVAHSACSQVVAPQAAAAGHVTFCLYAPQARTVALVGDFNGWGSAQRVELRQQDTALWTVALPLPRGHYQYAFVIDDKTTVTDPMAAQHVNDDFGHKNAVMTVS